MKIALTKESARGLAQAILKIIEFREFSSLEINKTLLSADLKKELNAKITFEAGEGVDNRFRFPVGKVEISIEETENLEDEN